MMPRCPIRGYYPGGGVNGYDRQAGRVSWRDGDTVAFGATFLLPRPFLSQVQGEVDLLRWDNYEHHPHDTDWGGIGIFGRDHLARLMRFDKAGRVSVLVGPFRLPRGRWFRIDVIQRLSDVPGQAMSEVFINHRLIGTSSRPNTYGRPIEMLRAGLVAIGAGQQHKPLTLYYGSVGASGVIHGRFSLNVDRP